MPRLIVSVVSIAFLLAGVPSAHAEGHISEKAIRAIEGQMVMPRGAQQLESYNRFYAFERLHGHGVIVGVFVLRSQESERPRDGAVRVTAIPNAFATTAKKLPGVLDGGCSVVTVYFDVQSQRLMPIQPERPRAAPQFGVCNGH